MKRSLSAVTLAAILAAPIACCTPARADDSAFALAPRSADLAPADRYFGRMRMSVLGIRNSISDIAARLDFASSDDLRNLYHKLTFVEDALLDLKDRYPEDTWLPRLGLHLAQTFARLPFPLAQIKSNDLLDMIVEDFPTSDEALVADDLRRARLKPVPTMDIPLAPLLPSYAVPDH